ncbi:hypothetical protein [Streptomyces sp. NPDC020742]|uniref:hypothetical protein n=1 Tax=Streptomyces sp. NPDC020742 TaxID=3154897 RepID=UPI00340C8A9A
MTPSERQSPTLTAHGIWCERFVYRSSSADDLLSWTAVAAYDPVRAVRLIGSDARRMASRLPEPVRDPKLRWLDAQGQVGAMAALARGEACGLSLNCSGWWVEWVARPVTFLPLVHGMEPSGPCRADLAQDVNESWHRHPTQRELDERVERLSRHFPQGWTTSLGDLLAGFRRLREALARGER